MSSPHNDYLEQKHELEQEALQALADNLTPWKKVGFPTKEAFDNDKVEAGTTNN